MVDFKETDYNSYLSGDLPEGCKYCVRGSKVVIYVTGLCPRDCWFCPLSERRKDKDVIWADEWPINDESEFDKIITESELIDAEGAGITGGDPLLKIDRTIKIIELLKNRFDDFHIHLYTSLNLVDKDKLKRLYDSGLDEIRFHPDFDNKKYWKRIKLAKEYDWDIGIEIPLLVDKKSEIIELVDYSHNLIDFLNLNEFEDPKKFDKELSKKSVVLGKEIINHAKRYDINIHLCTMSLKDGIQLKNRMKRRAKNVEKAYDIIDDGLLVRGTIYSKKLNPQTKNYNKLIKGSNQNIINDLINLKKELSEFVEDSLLEIDKERLKILTRIDIIEYLSKELIDEYKDFKFCIEKEYPTWDKIVIEREFLN
ncbi:MAG: radical SAM protein [Candidatus Woesearchaeota archaeon]